MWAEYFKLIGVIPGVLIIPKFGKIDFRNPNIPVETVKAIYEADCIYIGITPAGKEKFYGVKPDNTVEASKEIKDKPESIQDSKISVNDSEPGPKPEKAGKKKQKQDNK
ncbi:MAG: hypothetical protein HQ541_19500 [Mariniphaga sp.]|nr:hypothetical protein [Mariniphaga sp.]